MSDTTTTNRVLKMSDARHARHQTCDACAHFSDEPYPEAPRSFRQELHHQQGGVCRGGPRMKRRWTQDLRCDRFQVKP